MTPPSPTIEPVPPRAGSRRPPALLIAVLLAAVAAVAAFLVPSGGAGAAAGLPGADVSHYQGAIDFGAMKANGANFVYIKATEGTTYQDPKFSDDYGGATSAGLLRGGYHFARPDSSDGASQANYFLAHGGGWSSDGITLPGALDLENVAGVDYCYGLSTASMSAWIHAFSDTYHNATGVYPVLYTRANWWNQCTGSDSSFAATNPLWLASYNSTPGALPAGWGYYTFWQFADSGTFPGDQDVFNGTLDRLVALAKG